MKLKNASLERAFRKVCGKATEEITLEDLRRIEVLPVIGERQQRIALEPLDDIALLEGLTTLVMGFCDFQDLSPLRTLPSLSRLQMTYCEQATLQAISQLKIQELACGRTGLQSLDGLENLPLHGVTMEHNEVTSLAPLQAHPGLAFLKADGNPLIELSALDGLYELEKLSLSSCAHEAPDLFRDQLFYLRDKKLDTLELAHNELRDLLWLAQAPSLHQLRVLNLSGNTDLEDFSSLGLLTQLRQLNLTVCTGLRDLSFVRQLPNLEVLELKLCQYIEDFSPLYGHPSLRRVNLEAVPVPSLETLEPLLSQGVDVSYQESWIGATALPADTPMKLSLE